VTAIFGKGSIFRKILDRGRALRGRKEKEKVGGQRPHRKRVRGALEIPGKNCLRKNGAPGGRNQKKRKKSPAAGSPAWRSRIAWPVQRGPDQPAGE